MDYIINPTRELIEATFPIVPSIGETMNLGLMIIGGIATVIWIGFMLKYEKTEVPNR